MLDSLPFDDIGYIELRLDVIENINSSLATDIIKSIKEVTSTPIILTNRTSQEGGYFKGSDEERIKILVDNASFVELVDIEYDTDEKLRQTVIDAANKTIISYHNFDNTPSIEFLQDIVDNSFKIGDIPKVAVKPNTIEDTHILLSLLMKNRGMIAISMDKLGAYTRIIAPLLGSPVTYASITNQSAPGQFDIETTNFMINKLKCD